jgi:hypothetical protein
VFRLVIIGQGKFSGFQYPENSDVFFNKAFEQGMDAEDALESDNSLLLGTCTFKKSGD